MIIIKLKSHNENNRTKSSTTENYFLSKTTSHESHVLFFRHAFQWLKAKETLSCLLALIHMFKAFSILNNKIELIYAIRSGQMLCYV